MFLHHFVMSSLPTAESSIIAVSDGKSNLALRSNTFQDRFGNFTLSLA